MLEGLTVALERLVDRHGGGIWSEYALKLKVWRDPDGLYLIKGGGPEVWKRFRIKKEWREAQGIIHGKRCGASQNRPAARLRALIKQADTSDPALLTERTGERRGYAIISNVST